MDTSQLTRGRNPLAEAARETLETQLRGALRLVESDLGGNLPQLHATLLELADRAAALQLTQNDERAGPAAVLRGCCLSGAGETPPPAFLLIRFGEVTVERPAAGRTFVFTRPHAESACRWFAQLGRKLAIDYEHQTFDQFNRRPDGLRPAAGWIGGLEVRDDGLWATEVVWTERAAELLRGGEYRYFSPVIFWTDEDYSDVAALGPVALTNDPAMHGVAALAARRAEAAAAEEGAADPARGATEDARGAGEEALLRAELETARGELEILQRQLAGQNADAFIERGIRLGKILSSTTMDWRADYLRDPPEAEARLHRAPVVLPPGRLVRPPGAASRAGRADPGDSAPLRGWSVGPEDLAAFEQALAAGRVHIR